MVPYSDTCLWSILIAVPICRHVKTPMEETPKTVEEKENTNPEN